MINIRTIEPADIPALLLIEQSAHLSPWSQVIFNDSFTPRSHNFLIEDEQEIIGYVFSSFVAGELTLENICVAANKQGQGIGRRLLQHLFTQAQQLKALELWLEVRASNISAIALYDKFGFVEQGVRKHYYTIPNSNDKEDAILMCVKL